MCGFLKPDKPRAAPTPARAADPARQDTGAQVKQVADTSTASALFGKSPKKKNGGTVPGLNL